MADDDNFDPMSDGMLDQSEIDRLLAQAEAESKPSVIRFNGVRDESIDISRIEAYDFRNPAFLTEFELRRLRLLHEDFIRYLSARLSLFLRMECGLKMARLTTLTYEKFTEALPSPTHICLFKADPMLGVGVLDINPRLALTLVDRMLGGRGHSVKAERYLTEIEIALLEDVIGIILEEWCNQWKVERELHPTIIGHENNGRFLQTSPRDSVVLELTIECSFGDCSEAIQIGVPYYLIEPLVLAMHARRQKDVEPEKPKAVPTWREAYAHVDMPVSARWDCFEIPLREIANLRVGDMLELPTSLFKQTKVLFNGTPKFVGTVGLEGDQVVVQLDQKLPPQQREDPPRHGRNKS